MKRIIFVFIFTVFFLNLSSSEVFSSPSQNKNIFVEVAGPPIIAVNIPIQGTYYQNDSINLIVKSNSLNLLYSIDNGINATYLGNNLNTSLHVAQGNHVLRVFGNNSYGMTEKTVNFAVDLFIYNITYNNFIGPERGYSTDFKVLTFEEIQNFSGITLENIKFGKINFIENINITNDYNVSDRKTDIDNNIIITQNTIELKKEKLPNFDKKAILFFYNLSFLKPKILKNNLECLETECLVNYYVGGNLSFNVSGFSTYSVVEELTQIETGSDNAGSGSSSSVNGNVKKPNFEIDKKELKVKLKQGEIKKEIIEITNKENRTLKIKINSSFSETILDLKEKEVTLGPNEKNKYELEFKAYENTPPEMYIGEIKFESLGVEKKVLGVVEIGSRESLFDIKIEIVDADLKIYPGDKLKAIISLINLGEKNRADAEIVYKVINDKGEVVGENKETVAVETQSSFSREFEIPAQVREGVYILSASIEYEGKKGFASQNFEVVGENKKYELFLEMLIFLSLIVIIIFITLKNRKNSRFT